MSICRKRGFDTPSEAFSRLKEIQEYETRRETTPIRFYLCDRCTKYHLTHKTVQNYFATRRKPNRDTEKRKRRLRAYRERRYDEKYLDK